MTGATRVALALLIVALGGCAGGRPVPVEERSAGGMASRSPAAPGATRSAGALGAADAEARQAPPAMESAAPGAAPNDAPPSYPPPQNAPPNYAPPAAPASGSSPALLALLAQAEQQQRAGNSQRALSYLERAQRISPRDPLVYLQLARLRLALGELERATQLTQRGLALAPGGSAIERQLRQLASEIEARR